MHSRIFAINNMELSEEELYESIAISDYVVKESDEEMRDSIAWLRRHYLGQLSDSNFFDEKDIEIFIKEIKNNMNRKIQKIKKEIQDIEDGKLDDMNLPSTLWTIKELAYPVTEFFFITEEGYVCNEVEFLSFLKNVKSFEITGTFDYHY